MFGFLHFFTLFVLAGFNAVDIMESEMIKKNILDGIYGLVNKRKGKSTLWTIFSEIKDESGNILNGWLCCRNCKNIYKFNGKQTSNLNRHKCFIEKNSKESLKKLNAEKKLKTINVLADWIAEDCRPFSSVSGNGFRKMAKFFIQLGSKFGDQIDIDDLLPAATTLSRRINKQAEEEKFKLISEIPKIVKQNKASMTIDMWTDQYVRRNFLCATLHYEKDLVLQELVLGMKSMDSGSSSAENIYRKLMTILADFGVHNTTNLIFVTDRGSNVKKALKHEIRLNCSNHLLSNIVEAAFDENVEVKQIVLSCKNLVKYFTKGNLQQFLPTSLKNYCPTRWNSYYLMFKSISDNWREINNILEEKNDLQRINNINQSTITDLFKFCADIDIISRKLQGSKYPTLCYVLPSITRLKLICQPNEEDVQVLSALKINILHGIENIWMENLTMWHKTASFLFPPTMNIEELQQSVDGIKDFCTEQMMLQNEEEVTPNSSLASSSNSASEETLLTPAETSPQHDELQFFFPNLVTEPIISLRDRVHLEISSYMSERVQLNKNFDVMNWWGENRQKYPLLSKLALRTLSMPASSASSERVFSMAGNIITEKRSRLAPKTINNLIFLNSVLRNN